MNKAFEKILDMLEEYENNDLTDHDSELCEHCKRIDCEIGMDCFICVMDKAKQIVQEVAEEYNNGWIPCSVDLPKEKDGIVLICCEDGNVMTGKHSEFSDTWYKGNVYAVGGSNVIAWQPLPKPFKESD